jgi:YegS/Rv2252/BmrU family lipid kinase
MGSPKHIAIVCNPTAGVGKALKLAEKIISVLTEKKIAFRFFKENWPADFFTFTDIWIAGGDGTLNHFINQYPDVKLPIMIFKGGTGNDVHWLLYGTKTLEEQLLIALTAEPRPIDAGRCNDRLFLNGAGIGFEGEIVRGLTGKNKLPGKTSFMLEILKKIFFYHAKSYQITSGSIHISQRQLMISVTNGRRAGGGFQIAPEAEINDGLLDMILIDPLTPLQRLRYLPVIEKGKHLQLPFVHPHKIKNVVIESEETIHSHLDGEYYPSQKMEIEILPAKFLIRY